MKRFSLLTVVFSIAVGNALFAMSVLAQPTGPQGQPTTTATLAQSSVTATLPPTATVAFDPSSGCGSGLLQIALTTPIDMTYYYVLATTSTGTVLSDLSGVGNWGTSYTGTYGFPFNSTVPDGTIVTLYGYMGQTPPSAANTAEFSITYRCDTDQVLASCAGPYGPCIKGPDFPALDGRWFKLNAAVKGYTVDIAKNNAIDPHNFTAPFYMGFAWDTANTFYDVRVFTETAPGVWTNTSNATKITPIHSQNFLSDFGLAVHVNNATDYFVTFHTPYIKYVMDKTGVLKSAKYSGSGEVFLGSFNGGTLEYYGSVKISGSMVSVSQLPFTP